MEQQHESLAWPHCEGYLTLRPLDEHERHQVWLIQRESDQRYMVMKLIGNHEALASVRHGGQDTGRQYVVDFFGVISTQYGSALLVEYCPGGSLAHLATQRGPFSLGEAITALAPIAQTVALLHAEGVRHGDICPSNILLTSEGMPKLSDFQEAGLIFEKQELAGTPGFIAPELLTANSGEQAGQGDVYALGASLWYLLSGRIPEAPEHRPPVSLVVQDVPDSILDLLVDCLQLDPLQRPSAEQFARTLFSSGQAEPINWTNSVPSFATHLMATIHPPATRRGRRSAKSVQQPSAPQPLVLQPKAQAGLRGGGSPLPVTPQRPRLKPTPGIRRLVLSAFLGLLLLSGTGVGINHWLSTSVAGTQDQQRAVEAGSEHRRCAVQSDAQVPPCAQDATAIIASLVSLSASRDQALMTGEEGALSRIYVPDSQQLVQDRAMLKQLADLGLTIDGLATQLEDIKIIARNYPDLIVVGVTSSHSSYKYLGQDQTLAHSIGAGPHELLRIELAYQEDAWKISRVLERTNKSGTADIDDPTSEVEN